MVMIALSGCAPAFQDFIDSGPCVHPKVLEQVIVENMEHMPGVQDCTERLEESKKYLNRCGYRTDTIFQTQFNHVCVHWAKDGERGTILCLDPEDF